MVVAVCVCVWGGGGGGGRIENMHVVIICNTIQLSKGFMKLIAGFSQLQEVARQLAEILSDKLA